MSYCRFENTARDLRDCIYAIQDGEINDLSNSEIRAAQDLLALAEDLIDLQDELEEGIENSKSY